MKKYKNSILTIFLLLIIILLSPIVKADDSMYIGMWSGYIDLNGQKLNIRVNFTMDNNKLKGTIDIPSQNITEYPIEIKELNKSKIEFLMNDIPGDIRFDGELYNNEIRGSFFQYGNKFNFILEKQKNVKEKKELTLNGIEDDIEVPVKGGYIYGSITFPKVHDNNNPLAIIISGSGPTDRDGNSSLIDTKIDNLKEIAYYLTNNGIITVRFDKRGVAKSRKLVKDRTPKFSQYKDDIINVINYVKSNLGRKENQIFLVGHSEGSTLAIMTANNVNNLAGIILLAGPGFKQEDLLRNQLRKQNEILYENNKISSEDILSRALDDLISAIDNNQKFNINEYNIPDNYKGIYLSLNNQRDFSKEWLKTDPAQLLKNINIPTCIIQGSDDQQVSKKDADRLSMSVNEQYKSFNYINGVNHLLFKNNNNVDPEILEIITKFISKYK